MKPHELVDGLAVAMAQRNIPFWNIHNLNMVNTDHRKCKPSETHEKAHRARTAQRPNANTTFRTKENSSNRIVPSSLARYFRFFECQSFSLCALCAQCPLRVCRTVPVHSTHTPSRWETGKSMALRLFTHLTMYLCSAAEWNAQDLCTQHRIRSTRDGRNEIKMCETEREKTKAYERWMDCCCLAGNRHVLLLWP